MASGISTRLPAPLAKKVPELKTLPLTIAVPPLKVSIIAPTPTVPPLSVTVLPLATSNYKSGLVVLLGGAKEL